MKAVIEPAREAGDWKRMWPDPLLLCEVARYVARAGDHG